MTKHFTFFLQTSVLAFLAVVAFGMTLTLVAGYVHYWLTAPLAGKAVMLLLTAAAAYAVEDMLRARRHITR